MFTSPLPYHLSTCYSTDSCQPTFIPINFSMSRIALDNSTIFHDSRFQSISKLSLTTLWMEMKNALLHFYESRSIEVLRMQFNTIIKISMTKPTIMGLQVPKPILSFAFIGIYMQIQLRKGSKFYGFWAPFCFIIKVHGSLSLFWPKVFLDFIHYQSFFLFFL